MLYLQATGRSQNLSNAFSVIGMFEFVQHILIIDHFSHLLMVKMVMTMIS